MAPDRVEDDRMRRTMLLVLALAAAAGVAAAPAAQAGSITPSSGVYLGAFANEAGGISTLETDIGRRLALDRSYMPWTFTGWARRGAPDVAPRPHPQPGGAAPPAPTPPASPARPPGRGNKGGPQGQPGPGT